MGAFKFNLGNIVTNKEQQYTIIGRADYLALPANKYMIQKITEDAFDLDFSNATWVDENEIK